MAETAGVVKEECHSCCAMPHQAIPSHTEPHHRASHRQAVETVAVTWALLTSAVLTLLLTLLVTRLYPPHSVAAGPPPKSNWSRMVLLSSTCRAGHHVAVYTTTPCTLYCRVQKRFQQVTLILLYSKLNTLLVLEVLHSLFILWNTISLSVSSYNTVDTSTPQQPGTLEGAAQDLSFM